MAHKGDKSFPSNLEDNIVIEVNIDMKSVTMFARTSVCCIVQQPQSLLTRQWIRITTQLMMKPLEQQACRILISLCLPPADELMACLRHVFISAMKTMLHTLTMNGALEVFTYQLACEHSTTNLQHSILTACFHFLPKDFQLVVK
jgi:hypothetical protein